MHLNLARLKNLSLIYISIRIARVLKRRDLDNRVYASDEAREHAQTKAEEVEAGLDPKFPSFVKSMLQSHTTGGFWLVTLVIVDDATLSKFLSMSNTRKMNP